MRLSAYTEYLNVLAHHCSSFSRNCLGASLAAIIASGCAHSPREWETTVGNDTSDVDRLSMQIDHPAPEVFHEASMTARPITALVVSESNLQYSEKTLSDVLQEALGHASVMREFGGVLLRTPELARTNLASRIQESDPRFGMEAALSAFDAQLAASAVFNKNDRIYNNFFLGGGQTQFQQDLNDYQVELSKRSATGALMALRGVSNYNWSNAVNVFPSAWDSWLEGEVRQPLLQGGGLQFNRIAGPGSAPGVYNGILIARANADINQYDFNIALTDFVSNVENAYWDLYLSYRELDARKKTMEQALVVWNQAKAGRDRTEVEAANEPLARQQYYQLKAEVDEALSGRLVEGTHTRNGSTGGTFQAGGGVLSAERRLRLICGLPASDGTLIRPSEEPTMAEMQFDWESSLHEALTLRPEIQKQNVALKKREMELLAAKNYLNPKLDAVGRYRFRGLGDDLMGGSPSTGSMPASSLGNLASGDQQEWMMGVELTVPIGYRKGHAAVSHAELMVVRERMVLKEQQREIASNLSGATADVVRAYQAVQNNLNQYLAAQDYFRSLTTQEGKEITVQPDRLLDSQRRVVNSEIQFFRSRTEYAIALKNFHYEKGALLVYKDLRIADEVTPVSAGPVSVSSEESPDTAETAPTTAVPSEPEEGENGAIESPQDAAQIGESTSL